MSQERLHFEATISIKNAVAQNPGVLRVCENLSGVKVTKLNFKVTKLNFY